MRTINLVGWGSGALFLFCITCIATAFVVAPWSVGFWISSVFLTPVALAAVLAYGFIRATDDWC